MLGIFTSCWLTSFALVSVAAQRCYSPPPPFGREHANTHTVMRAHIQTRRELCAYKCTRHFQEPPPFPPPGPLSKQCVALSLRLCDYCLPAFLAPVREDFCKFCARVLCTPARCGVCCGLYNFYNRRTGDRRTCPPSSPDLPPYLH